MWFLLTKTGLWKMDGKGFALEKVRALPSPHPIMTANFDSNNLVVDFDAKDPTFAPEAPAPSPAPVKPPGTSTPTKPAVRWVRSPNFSARGSKIDRVILHYTTSANIDGSISWFQNPDSKVSAHYIVGRDGRIVQMVKDGDKAWHAFGENDDSIGIEHVATKGQVLTQAQSDATAALIRWLKAEYHLNNGLVTAHRFTKSNAGRTDCPGDLWKTEAELRSWLASWCPDGDVSAPKPPAPAPTAKFILVPYFSQRDFGGSQAWSICGVTSAAMVLAFWGITTNPDKVLDKHGKAAGQSPSGLEGIFEKEGLKADSTYKGSLGDIRKHVEAGRPCIVHGYFTAPGHILVVVGFDKNGVFCNDPAGEWEEVVGDSYSDNPKNGKAVHYPFSAFGKAIGDDGDIWYSVAWK